MKLDPRHYLFLRCWKCRRYIYGRQALQGRTPMHRYCVPEDPEVLDGPAQS